MSKQGKRKITVELPKTKELISRPSVFERLGTKKKSSVKKTTEYCRQWAQHGSCAYGKSCKFATTHTLISPSKQRAANSEIKRFVKDDAKNRLHSTVVVRPGRSPDGEIDNWDQNDLEYADTDVLEKRRLQLQRELELQLKMDTGKDMRKDKKKPVSSSSSSRSSSSSSVSSSSSDGSTSSSSTGRDARRKGKKGKLKRRSSSSTDGDVPAKKKIIKSDNRKDKNEVKKISLKKDDRLLNKKHDNSKKKELSKVVITKKSLSPGKKLGGTPPINKNITKAVTKHGKSPQKRERNRTVSPHSVKEREKDRDRGKEKDREKEREKDREKDRQRVRGRSRSPRKAKSRSPRRHSSHSKDTRKKSLERSRQVSPKKQVRRDASSEKLRKASASRERDRGRDNKGSLERRKDKNDDKERHERKDRGRDRNKDTKRDDSKRRGKERGLGGRGGSDKGLEKPNKPMERLLPRPEERLAALAAISNRAIEADKSGTSKDRQDTHSDKGGRKQERNEKDRSNKRDRLGSIDREGDYDINMERQYERGHSIEHYERGDDRYDDGPREDNRSPGYGIQGRERHYEQSYDMSGPSRGYPEDDDYGERMGEHRNVDIGYEDRRPHRDSWEGRSNSVDHERGYMHSHKEWENEDYRAGGEWGRERHWQMHDSQMGEWGEKEPEIEGWHHRGHPSGPHRGRIHDNYGRGMRTEINRGEGNKRRSTRIEEDNIVKEIPPTAPPVTAVTSRQEVDPDDNPIPDDLSEISDDPDDILNRDDMIDQNTEEDSQPAQTVEETTSKPDSSEKESTQDTSGVGEEKESQDVKDEDDVTNMDFEEISDGELEEERTRAGLGDALGVDWASLVADVRRREQIAPTGGARDRWKPERVLTRLGISIEMAGKDTVNEILQKNQEIIQEERQSRQNIESNNTTEQNGKQEDSVEKTSVDVNSLHPIAAIQVAVEKRKRQRAILFGSGYEITRALSARRDLALRRYLCHLPATERSGQSRVAPQPALFQAARALLMQTPV